MRKVVIIRLETREKRVQVKRRGDGNRERERKGGDERSSRYRQIAGEAKRGGMERDKRRAVCACLAKRETFSQLVGN